MEDGHRILYSDDILPPSEIIVWDPCHFELPALF